MPMPFLSLNLRPVDFRPFFLFLRSKSCRERNAESHGITHTTALSRPRIKRGSISECQVCLDVSLHLQTPQQPCLERLGIPSTGGTRLWYYVQATRQRSDVEGILQSSIHQGSQTMLPSSQQGSGRTKRNETRSLPRGTRSISTMRLLPISGSSLSES